MFLCPRCPTKLLPTMTSRGRRHVCSLCNGHAVTYDGLRSAVDARALQALWVASGSDLARKHLHCPACLGKMRAVPLGESDAPLHVDVCRKCHMVWFDAREEEQLPGLVSGPVFEPKLALSETASAALRHWRREEALAQVRRLAEAHKRTAPPANAKDRWLGYLGVPAEEGVAPVAVIPFLTWQLVVLCVMFQFLAWNSGSPLLWLGFHPDNPWLHHGAGVLTTFFVHAGWSHLVSNMCFLMIFGDNVEELLGPLRYVTLLVLGTASASMCHALITPYPHRVLVGASGGISALIVFYALAFPRAKLKFFFLSRYSLRHGKVEIPAASWFSMPVRVGLFLWLVVQSFGLLNQLDGRTSVSAAAHIGGACVGLVAWLWFARGGREHAPTARMV